jgi:cobalamin biosynthesis protein CobD/CbiB
MQSILQRQEKSQVAQFSPYGSACAGALGLRLGGTNLYFGVPVEKPTIGDALRRIEAEDIKRQTG